MGTSIIFCLYNNRKHLKRQFIFLYPKLWHFVPHKRENPWGSKAHELPKYNINII